ncbi:MAG TPA: phosphoribosylglycinamide formyltransferase [Thermodesulfovibrionales bacterium]|nr:phosphoribosylglycinamide formyltransferase [Thermodesulfovibrionales bacterium]
MSSDKSHRLNLGVLASGRGSNFQSIIDEISRGNLQADIRLLIVDKADAFAIERARKHGIDHLIVRPGDFTSKDHFYIKIVDELRKRDVELVILAGFMRIVGRRLIDAFPNRIMNIHPALLPSFPGLHSQRQAVEYGVRISGCTVHFVDEGMDTGPVISQAAVPVYHDDTEDTLSERILKLEHKIYPQAIRLFSEGRLEVQGRIVKIRGDRDSNAFLLSPS